MRAGAQRTPDGERGLTAEQVATCFDRGYVVVEALFDPAEIAAIRAAFDRLEATARTLPHTGLHRGAHFVVDQAPFRLHRVVWCGAAEPLLAELGAKPRLLAAAAAVLGTREMDQLINQAHFKLPGDEVAFPWHQDSTHRRYGTPLWTDVNGRGSFVEVATAVDPMTLDNGPLRFVPGSGRGGHIPVDPATGELPPDAFDERDAVAVTLRPGDAVLFGPYTIHGSGPNRSLRPRRLFLNGFACPGANRRLYPGDGAGRRLVAPAP